MTADESREQHEYRSPVAAILGLTESALLRDDLDADLVKQLKAIHSLAEEALQAAEVISHGTRPPEQARSSRD